MAERGLDQQGFDGRGFGGRPTLPTGEPIIARWFVIMLLIVVPIGIGIIAWAFLSFDREPVSAAARRPPGDATQTHFRGQAALAETLDEELFVGCVEGIRLVGDEGGIATVRRALQATCQLAESAEGRAIEDGLVALAVSGGLVRVAVFEQTGVDASTRIENGVPVVEINAKFQFNDAAEAAPALVHELTHLAAGWPAFGPVDAKAELEAVMAQQRACQRLSFRGNPPRTCLAADELLEGDDPLGALLEAGYR
jgi:hypothetical protein